MDNDPEKAAIANIMSFVVELLAKAQVKNGLQNNPGLADVAQSGQLAEGTSSDTMLQAGASPQEAMAPVADNAAAKMGQSPELANTAAAGQKAPASYNDVIQQMIAEPDKDDEEEAK